MQVPWCSTHVHPDGLLGIKCACQSAAGLKRTSSDGNIPFPSSSIKNDLRSGLFGTHSTVAGTH